MHDDLAQEVQAESFEKSRSKETAFIGVKQEAA
jgi:hypothetical protein